MAASAKVGTAYAEYRLDLAGFRKDVSEARRSLKELQDAGKGIGGKAPSSAPLKGYGDSAQRAAQQALGLARAEAQLLASQGDLAGAAARLQQALAGVDQKSLAAVRAQTQLANIQRKIAAEAAGSSAAFTRQGADLQRLSSAAAGVGPQLAQFAAGFVGVQAGAMAAGAALNLAREGFNIKASIDASRVALGAFLGDQDKANKAFESGAVFAERYKIKQSEIAGALNSLAPLLRTSTTETEKQLEVLARLQTLRPGATFQDAAFSVKELAGGDYASIVEQFNLSREAAQRLRDEVAGGADVFQVLDRELANMGASVANLEARTKGAAGAQAAYEKAVEDFKISIGTLVTGPGTALLNWLADAAKGATLVADNIGQLFTAEQQAQAAAAGAFSGASTYDEYAQRIGFVNEQLGRLGMSVAQLTPQQFSLAQSLVQTGASAEQATAAALALGDTYTNALGQASKEGPAAVAAIESLSPAIATVAASSADGANQAALLLQSYTDGVTGAAELGGQVQQLASDLAAEAAQQAAASAETDAATQAKAEAEAAAVAYSGAINAGTDSIAENMAATLQAEYQTQNLAAAQAYLAQLGGQVASGLITAANAAAQLAARYGIASAEAARLINLQATLARQQAVKAAGFAGVPEAYLGAAIGGRAGGSTTGPGNNVLTQIADESEAAAQRYKAAVSDYERAEARAARGGSGGGGGGKGKGGKGKGGKGGKSEAERLAEKEAKEQKRLAEQAERERERQLERLADLEESHQKKILDIQKRYAEKQRDQERQNNVDKINSRADFYDAVTSAEGAGDIDPAQAQKLAAAYEQAFAESQRLAQEGKAKLAADYLELRQQQIEQELAYEQKVAEQRKALAEAQEAGDEDAAKRAQNELARLEQIEAMRRQAREEELKQLLEGGDQNQAERDQALAEEQQKYIEQQAEILGVSEEVAAARVAGEERVATATRTATDALREHLAMLQQVNAASVGRNTPVTPDPAAAPPASSAAPSGAEAAPSGAEAEGQAAGPKALAVVDQAAQLALVDIRDQLGRLAEQVAQLAPPLQDTARNTADTARAVDSLGSGPLG